MTTDPKKRPPNVPAAIWAVQYADGERHFSVRPLDGDMAKWAAGQKGVTVIEYEFKAILHHAPVDPGKKK